jgi:hypothetical protein
VNKKAAFFLLIALVLTGCASATAGTPLASATPTPSYRESVLADHPVAYWPMDETAGTAMTDATSNHNDGSYQGAVKLAQPGPMSGAVALDGKGTWAAVPDAASLHLDAVTLELWVKKRTDSEYGGYLTKNVVSGGGLGSGWFQLLNSHHDGRLEFRVTADYATLTSTQILAPNAWYYVVATYDGTTARLFINGKLDSSASVAATAKQTADPVLIGRRADGLFNDTQVSQVAIYPTALPAERIAAHWHSATAAR